MNDTSSGAKPNSDGADFVAEAALPNRPEATTDEQSKASCEHDWQRDGQTMMSVRWTCCKCGKTMLC